MKRKTKGGKKKERIDKGLKNERKKRTAIYRNVSIQYDIEYVVYEKRKKR